MASASASGKPQSPILLLKDYLRDDLSSCSSSGFISLPRRQCCLQRRSFSSSSSSFSSSCAAKSALQRASEAVLNVIKSLQIPASLRSHPSSSLSKTRTRKAKKGVLSRSFSRRLSMSRNFWRRASSKGDSKPCTFVSSSASDNNTCVETSFTCSLTAAEDSTDIEGSVTTTTTANTCSATNSTREWPNEEKEQFSPVSVLDCPLFDDDEEITSPFNSTAWSSLEGAKHKHMQKSGQFNRVASLKPVALVKRISWSELQGNEPTHNLNGHRDMLRDNKVDEKVRDLLNHVKRSINPSNCLRIEAENMLLDFFKQNIIDIDDSLMKRHLCKVAEDWIRGQPQEQYLSWEGRQLYVKEMDKCGGWRNSDEEEMQCVAMELEVGLFTSLVNELLVDLTTCMI